MVVSVVTPSQRFPRHREFTARMLPGGAAVFEVSDEDSSECGTYGSGLFTTTSNGRAAAVFETLAVALLRSTAARTPAHRIAPPRETDLLVSGASRGFAQRMLHAQLATCLGALAMRSWSKEFLGAIGAVDELVRLLEALK